MTLMYSDEISERNLIME